MELKPCPFCGCKRILITVEKGAFKIMCDNCVVFMLRRKSDQPDEAYQNLLHRWNRRTPSGMYRYDLTAAEMNADTIAIPPGSTEKERTASDPAGTTPATPPATPLAGRQQVRQQKRPL